MLPNNRLNLALCSLACLFAAGSWVNSTTPSTAAQQEQEAIEISALMQPLQVHAAKLWKAGSAGNWPLAEYQVHEVEETLETIENCPDLEDEGVPLAPIAMTVREDYLGPVAVAIEEESSEKFVAAYDRLLEGCNACHKTTQHEFIRIQRPDDAWLSNQRYTVDHVN